MSAIEELARLNKRNRSPSIGGDAGWWPAYYRERTADLARTIKAEARDKLVAHFAGLSRAGVALDTSLARLPLSRGRLVRIWSATA